jgi:peptidoglycan/xylan/chitin deacetylase (PgdA/CDA1 family)
MTIFNGNNGAAAAKRKSHLLARALMGTDAIKLVNALWGPNRLTVLAYHRVVDLDAREYPYYRPNVSTTPAIFARQIAFLAENFNVIDIARLQAYITQDEPLPSHPLLITFDDGYIDNFHHAFPVLRAYNIPATIFLVTSRMTNPSPLWWDEVAYYFFHTRKSTAWLPLFGECNINSQEQRDQVCDALIQRLKRVPHNWLPRIVEQVQQALCVDTMPRDTPHFVCWDQVRQLVAGGISCQPHTVTHPILSRISADDMRREIIESRDEVIRQTGKPAIAFTYPNGNEGDYNATAVDLVQEAGFSMAFSYTQGAMQIEHARRYPLELPRLHVGMRDTFEIFAMRVTGSRPVQAKTG